MRAWLVVSVLVLASACGPAPRPDGGSDGGGGADAGFDAGSDAGRDDFDAGTWDGGTLQLNDVSVLFPLAQSAAELQSVSLKPSASGARGVLLSSTLYDALGHLSGSTGNPPPGGIGEALYADLHVVAVRVDPCFAELNATPSTSGCENQLRLIVQEVRARTGTASAFDSAMHVFYRLTRAEVLEFARGVALLREANAPGQRLGKLAPHPVMVTQGLSGPMASGVRALILRYAGAQNLFRVTKMSASTSGFGWDFSGFEVGPTQQLTAMVIPSLAMSATTQSLFSGFSIDNPEAFFSPSTTHADDFTALAHTTSAAQLTAMQRSAAMTALVRVNHPNRHSPNTIDCASCHFTTPTSVLIARAKYSLDEATWPEAFMVSGPAVTPAELVPTFQTTGGFNVHAFSYFERDPGINQRVVNESAAVVEFLNQL